jgi:hypothetical protein
LLHDARPVLLNLGEPGHYSNGCLDSARRVRGMGGGPDPAGARRCSDHLGRTARGNVAHRLPTSFCREYQKTSSKQ